MTWHENQLKRKLYPAGSKLPSDRAAQNNDPNYKADDGYECSHSHSSTHPHTHPLIHSPSPSSTHAHTHPLTLTLIHSPSPSPSKFIRIQLVLQTMGPSTLTLTLIHSSTCPHPLTLTLIHSPSIHSPSKFIRIQLVLQTVEPSARMGVRSLSQWADDCATFLHGF